MKKEANSLIEATMANLSMVATLMINQSMRCYLPLKKWEKQLLHTKSIDILIKMWVP